MKLNESPFEMIKNGTKTIEFRLYDEKRQGVKIGDKIEFSKLPDLQEKLLVDVLELYQEDTFERLFRKLSFNEEEVIRKTRAMHEIYSPEKEQQYGVLGIKIKINVDSLKENLEEFEPYNEQEEVDKKIILDYINNFDDIGWYYDLHMGDTKIKQSEVCGKLIKIKSNKDTSTKYCEKCKEESIKESKREWWNNNKK